MRLSISEILDGTAKLKKKDEKLNFLRQHYSRPLATVLEYALNPKYKWLLPKGEVPYKPSPDSGNETALYGEARRLYLFVEGGNPNLQQRRREILFVELLGHVHPNDAKLLASMKDGKMPYKGITKSLVKEAFGDQINLET